MSIKLSDWLDLAHALPDARLDIRPVAELRGGVPDIVEAFATRDDLLSPTTFPTLTEHLASYDIRCYWEAVRQSGIPAIPVYPVGTVPDEFPVYVRGRTGSFTNGVLRSREEFLSVCGDRDVVVRPYAPIEACVARPSVTKELRVHVVCGRVACVEFLFPPWASQRPSSEEIASGCEWTADVSPDVVKWAESLALFIECRWFTADFAATPDGPQLVEINPGWCSGVTDPCSTRAVHLAVLELGFDVSLDDSLQPTPVACVPYTLSGG